MPFLAFFDFKIKLALHGRELAENLLHLEQELTRHGLLVVCFVALARFSDRTGSIGHTCR